MCVCVCAYVCVGIADNGLIPDDATQKHCQELGIQYRFYPIPNKTYALYKTAEEIYDTYHDDAKALVLLDDDTQLPEKFFVRKDLLTKPLVAGYCAGITIAKSPDRFIFQGNKNSFRSRFFSA